MFFNQIYFILSQCVQTVENHIIKIHSKAYTEADRDRQILRINRTGQKIKEGIK
jgi:hypothetical protein